MLRGCQNKLIYIKLKNDFLNKFPEKYNVDIQLYFYVFIFILK